MDIASLLREILDDAKYGEICELAAGNPDTDSSIPPKNGSCPWNLLLRELRDAIFEYTYAPRSDALKILYKERDKSTRLRSGGSRKLLLFECYVNRFLVCKQWASEAAQAVLSITELRFEKDISRTFFPRTCLVMANLNTLNLEMRDLVLDTQHLPTVCPCLRQIRIGDTYSGVWACEIEGEATLYRSKWTRAMIRSSSGFIAIRPLSGLEKVSVNFLDIIFHDKCFYRPFKQDNIRTNTALVQMLVKQSATRPREAP